MNEQPRFSFSANIIKVGINPCVAVPQGVSDGFGGSGKQGNIPVIVTINGKSFRTTLVPLGNGRHRLYINGEMRQKAEVNTGDTIEVELQYDPKPKVLSIPEDLKRSLEKNKKAREHWEALTPSRRKEILSYLNHLKTPEALERNIKKTVSLLLRD